MSTPPRTGAGSTGISPLSLVGASGAPSRIVLVASDGSSTRSAPIRFAAALAAERALSPTLVSVLQPLPSITPPLGGGIVAVPSDPSTPARRQRRREELMEQVREAGANPDAWPMSIVVGLPSQEIEDAVVRHDAGLVVLGLRPRGAVERIFREDLVMDVVRASSAPTIAVAREHDRLPRRIVVAMDFSRAAVHAARCAATIAAEEAELILAHVGTLPDRRHGEDAEGSELVRQLGIARAFDDVLRELPDERRLVYTPTVLEGIPDDALLTLAARLPADVVAVGTHRRSGVERFFLGSVTQALLRAVPCSILAARGDQPR